MLSLNPEEGSEEDASGYIHTRQKKEKTKSQTQEEEAEE